VLLLLLLVAALGPGHARCHRCCREQARWSIAGALLALAAAEVPPLLLLLLLLLLSSLSQQVPPGQQMLAAPLPCQMQQLQLLREPPCCRAEVHCQVEGRRGRTCALLVRPDRLQDAHPCQTAAETPAAIGRLHCPQVISCHAAAAAAAASGAPYCGSCCGSCGEAVREPQG
jgi:hypothetical protein